MNFTQEDIDKIACRLKNKIVINSNSCWEWQGYKHIGKKRSDKGYGRMVFKRKNYYVHRLSFFIFNGHLHDDLMVCHHCDNPSCINPVHLWEGTREENFFDAVKKKRMKGSIMLTKQEVIEIIEKFYLNNNFTQINLAKDYNVSKQAISQIICKFKKRLIKNIA